MNSLPSKFPFPITVFSLLEDPFDRKCNWKELWGAFKPVHARRLPLRSLVRAVDYSMFVYGIVRT